MKLLLVWLFALPLTIFFSSVGSACEYNVTDPDSVQLCVFEHSEKLIPETETCPEAKKALKKMRKELDDLRNKSDELKQIYKFVKDVIDETECTKD